MGKSVRFQARGVSMKPLVRDGDVLVVEPLGQDQPRVGEVVLCSTASERMVVHRVIRRQIKNGIQYSQVQGDQIPQADGWMSDEEVLGRVTTLERDGRVIKMDGIVMRALGRYAAFRSRRGAGQIQLSGFGGKIARSLPFIGDFLK